MAVLYVIIIDSLVDSTVDKGKEQGIIVKKFVFFLLQQTMNGGNNVWCNRRIIILFLTFIIVLLDGSCGDDDNNRHHLVQKNGLVVSAFSTPLSTRIRKTLVEKQRFNNKLFLDCSATSSSSSFKLLPKLKTTSRRKKSSTVVASKVKGSSSSSLSSSEEKTATKSNSSATRRKRKKTTTNIVKKREEETKTKTNKKKKKKKTTVQSSTKKRNYWSKKQDKVLIRYCDDEKDDNNNNNDDDFDIGNVVEGDKDDECDEESSSDAEVSATTTTTTRNKNKISRLQFKVQGNPRPLRRHRTSRGIMYNPSQKFQNEFLDVVKHIMLNENATTTTTTSFLPTLPIFEEDEILIMTIVFRLRRPRNHFIGNKAAAGTTEGMSSSVKNDDGTNQNFKINSRMRPSAPHYTSPTRTDVDNLIKFVLDSMNKYLYEDDKQIMSIQATKILDDEGLCEGSTEITIESIHKDDVQERLNL